MGGRWRRDSLPFRLTKAVERRAVHRADAIVVLTKRVRDYLFGGTPPANVHVIPCCVDVDRIEAARERRTQIRRSLGLDGRVVLVYVGKFTGWYTHGLPNGRKLRQAINQLPDVPTFMATVEEFLGDLLVEEAA